MVAMVLTPLDRFLHHVATMGVLMCIGAALCSDPALAGKPLYSYTDERGHAVITDDFSRIPADRRAQVTVVDHDTGRSGSRPLTVKRIDESVRSFVGGIFSGKTVDFPGMSSQQSKILTYAGLIGFVCLLGMTLSRGQGIRFLSLWCLVMTAIATPVLLYTSQDGPADIMKSKAAEIQDKQSKRVP